MAAVKSPRRSPDHEGREKGREGRDADDRDAGRKPDAAGGRDADPQARIAAGPDRDGDPVQALEAALHLGGEPVEERQQGLRVAALHGDGLGGQRHGLSRLDDAGRAGAEGGIDGKDAQRSSPSGLRSFRA